LTIKIFGISQFDKLSLQKPSQHRRTLLLRPKETQLSNNIRYNQYDRWKWPNSIRNEVWTEISTIRIFDISQFDRLSLQKLSQQKKTFIWRPKRTQPSNDINLSDNLMDLFWSPEECHLVLSRFLME